MKKLLSLPLILIILVACGNKNEDHLVKITTKFGDVTVLLYDETPLHKKNFLELAKSGAYNSTIFHRVIKNFMVQGGNVAEKEGKQEKAGNEIPAEIVKGFYHTRGTLAAARQSYQNPERKSSATQFYIVDGQPWEMISTDLNTLYEKMQELLQDTANRELIEEYQAIFASRDQKKTMDFIFSKKEMVEAKYGIDLTLKNVTKNDAAYKVAGGGAPHLDGEYTVFGRVVEGLEIIDKIASVKTGDKNRPISPISMTMELIEVKKKDISEKYGYQYKD